MLLKSTSNVLGSCNFKWLRVAETAHPTTIARLIGRSVFGAWCESISCEEKYPRHIQANLVKLTETRNRGSPKPDISRSRGWPFRKPCAAKDDAGTITSNWPTGPRHRRTEHRAAPRYRSG